MKEKGFGNRKMFNHEREKFCEDAKLEPLAMK
jgi:hypothetical protein